MAKKVETDKGSDRCLGKILRKILRHMPGRRFRRSRELLINPIINLQDFSIGGQKAKTTSKEEFLKAIKSLGAEEAFTDLDAMALIDLAQWAISKIAPPRFLEVGTWKGKSTACLSVVAANHGGLVYTVDHYQGNEGTWNIPEAQKTDIFAVFRKNMRLINAWQTAVKPMVMGSVSAAAIIKPGSLDLVFLDGDHRYTSIMQDIQVWSDKVRPGGIICGHDCEAYYDDLPPEAKRAVDDNPDTDYLQEYRVHPGVVKALYNHFGKV